MLTQKPALVMIVAVSAVLIGCGPMVFPAVERLDPEEQAEVDRVWDALLNPAAKADRQVLLDALLLQRLHQRGVDRLVLRSEKSFEGGTAVLEVFFDLSNEAADRFDLTVFDMDNKMLRHESWHADEVVEAAQLFYSLDLELENEPPEAAEARMARAAEREQRLRAVAEILGVGDGIDMELAP